MRIARWITALVASLLLLLAGATAFSADADPGMTYNTPGMTYN
jgi:hypothetical protein